MQLKRSSNNEAATLHADPGIPDPQQLHFKLIHPTVRKVIAMQTKNIKQTAYPLIDQLPDNITWDDLLYKFVVHREIEQGLADSKAGRTRSVEDVMKEFGFKE